MLAKLGAFQLMRGHDGGSIVAIRLMDSFFQRPILCFDNIHLIICCYDLQIRLF